jgi:hypothetical protein
MIDEEIARFRRWRRRAKITLAGLGGAALIASLAWSQGFGPTFFQSGGVGGPSIAAFVDNKAGMIFGPGFVGMVRHWVMGDDAALPTLNACAGATVVAGSTDVAGQVNTATASCAINFSRVWNTAPTCMLTDYTGARAGMSLTVTTTVITAAGLTAADNWGWFCVGKSGG